MASEQKAYIYSIPRVTETTLPVFCAECLGTFLSGGVRACVRVGDRVNEGDAVLYMCVCFFWHVTVKLIRTQH